ncbi:hypothetical protein ASG94_12870 [Nocardioides sp. Soil805]|nr:hypothetical protein ASG94_12870 [Nocardioides sp. Soil805]
MLSTAALALVLLAGGCGDEEPSPEPNGSAGEPEPACLVTAEQLAEITGTPQEVREVDVPGGGLGTELACETVLDEREVSMRWSLREPGIDPPPTLEEQRTYVEDPGNEVETVDLGAGQSGWVGFGTSAGLTGANVVTLLDDLMFQTSVTAYDDTGVSVEKVRDEALALAEAVVAGQERVTR